MDPPGAAMMDLVPMHLLVWLFEIFTKDTELDTCFALFLPGATSKPFP